VAKFIVSFLRRTLLHRVSKCQFHLQQVVKCEWGQAGNCLYLYGKKVVGQSGRSQSEVRGELEVVGVKRACSHGGGEYISLYEHLVRNPLSRKRSANNSAHPDLDNPEYTDCQNT
jgi:hypothetical protein